MDKIRRQSANPLDPRVQEQVGNVQQQVRGLEMEAIVEQGQLESFCDVKVGENLVE